MTRRRTAVVTASAMGMLMTLGACGDSREEVTVGLITKQEENPYWLALRETAEKTADDQGVTLLTATGTSDADVESQQKAIADMVAKGVDGILIAPTDSAALLPAVEAARAAGVIVIALDTPFDPVDAVDAYFTTDNVRAGELVGEYAAAKAKELGMTPQVAMLGLTPGFLSGDQREAGFLVSMGLDAKDTAIVADVDTQGDRELANDAMAKILQDNQDVNVVYAVNEPAALGALDALGAANIDPADIVLVSVDGGCGAIKDGVRPGLIDATAQQYPANMAREGVLAIVDAVRDDQPPNGYLDTGVQLITGNPAPGVDSRDVAYGVRNCWGE